MMNQSGGGPADPQHRPAGRRGGARHRSIVAVPFVPYGNPRATSVPRERRSTPCALPAIASRLASLLTQKQPLTQGQRVALSCICSKTRSIGNVPPHPAVSDSVEPVSRCASSSPARPTARYFASRCQELPTLSPSSGQVGGASRPQASPLWTMASSASTCRPGPHDRHSTRTGSGCSVRPGCGVR